MEQNKRIKHKIQYTKENYQRNCFICGKRLVLTEQKDKGQDSIYKGELSKELFYLWQETCIDRTKG